MCYCIALIALMDSYIMWNNYPAGKAFTYGLKVLVSIYFFFLVQKNTTYKYLIFLSVIPFAWGTLEESNFVQAIQYIISAAMPVYVFSLMKDEEQLFSAKLYIQMFTTLLIIGTPIYFLINIFNIPHLVEIRGDGRDYWNYFFLYYSRPGLISRRFTSVFDEPGVVATIISVILLYYRHFISKFQYILLVIVGFLTFSLFYFIVLLPILYLGNLRYLNPVNQLKRYILFGVLLVVGYFSVVMFGRTTKDGGAMEVLVYNRFEWKNDWIVGIENNRDVMIGFDEGFKKMQHEGGKPYWVGYGKNAAMDHYGSSGLSYRIYWYEKGLISLVYVALVFLGMHNWRRDALFSIFSFGFLVLLFFQRPSLFLINYYMLVYVGIVLIPNVLSKKDK